MCDVILFFSSWFWSFFFCLVRWHSIFLVERLNNHISLARVSINYISKSTVHSVIWFGNKPHTHTREKKPSSKQKPHWNINEILILMFGSFIFDVCAFARLLKKCAYFRSGAMSFHIVFPAIVHHFFSERFASISIRLIHYSKHTHTHQIESQQIIFNGNKNSITHFFNLLFFIFLKMPRVCVLIENQYIYLPWSLSVIFHLMEYESNTNALFVLHSEFNEPNKFFSTPMIVLFSSSVIHTIQSNHYQFFFSCFRLKIVVILCPARFGVQVLFVLDSFLFLAFNSGYY